MTNDVDDDDDDNDDDDDDDDGGGRRRLAGEHLAGENLGGEHLAGEVAYVPTYLRTYVELFEVGVRFSDSCNSIVACAR